MACGLAAHRPRDARCDIAAHRQVRKQQVVLEENSQVPLLGRQRGQIVFPQRDAPFRPESGGERAAEPGEESRSEEHTSELQSLMRISYAVFCLKKKTNSKPQL